MKVVWLVVCLAAILVGIGAACGPQEKYCYSQHLSCSEAETQAKQRFNQQQMMKDASEVADSSITVGGDL